MNVPDKIIDASAEVALEVYTDGLKSATIEVGDALGAAVHVALKPMWGLIWGADQVFGWVERMVGPKLAPMSGA